MTRGATQILHVGLESPAWRVGGLNRYLDELRRAQDGLGELTDVVWIDSNDDDAATAIRPGRNWVFRWRDFARVIRRSPAEILDVHFAPHAYWALRTGAFRRRPYIVHFQGPWALESRSGGERGFSIRVKRHVEGYVLRRAARVVTLSHAFQRIAIESYNVAPNRVEVIAPGVAANASGSRDDVRAALHIAATDTLIVAVRRLVPRMGLDRAIEIFAQIHREHEQLVIVGEGPERPSLEQLVRDHHLESCVRFVGQVDHDTLARWFRAADLSVVPSVAYEGFGLVVYESLAAGTPVMASDVDGLRDAAKGTSAVRLVDMSPHSWRVAIDEMVHHDEIRVEAHNFSTTKSWDAVARKHREIYDSVLDGTLAKLVVIVDHTAKLSGGELAMTRLVSAFDTRTWRAHFVLAERGPLCDELERREISYEVLALRESARGLAREQVTSTRGVTATLQLAVYACRLRRILRHRSPNVVHTNSMKAHLYGVMASFAAPWPVVAHVRDLWAPPYLKASVAQSLRLFVWWGPDYFVANSLTTASVLRTPATVIGSPVEEHFFRVSAPQDSAVVNLAVIGRLAPWKGQDLAIRALAELKSGPPCHLHIVGDALFGETKYATWLRELVDELQVSDRVSFHGHLDDIAEFLGTIDIAILSSRLPEPFGNVVVEAMAAGRTVVVPNRGGVTEFVSDRAPNFTGFFYEIDNVTSLVQVLQRVIVDFELRRWVGANARRAAAQFQADELAIAMENFYDELV